MTSRKPRNSFSERTPQTYAVTRNLRKTVQMQDVQASKDPPSCSGWQCPPPPSSHAGSPTARPPNLALLALTVFCRKSSLQCLPTPTLLQQYHKQQAIFPHSPPTPPLHPKTSVNILLLPLLLRHIMTLM